MYSVHILNHSRSVLVRAYLKWSAADVLFHARCIDPGVRPVSRNPTAVRHFVFWEHHPPRAPVATPWNSTWSTKDV